MVKISKNTKHEVFETVADMIEDALQWSYFKLIDGPKPAMYNIVEHVLTEIVHASQDRVL